jgi:predicted amidophosphoribosyltransferase
VVLVDDVVTTGATMLAAIDVLGVSRVLAATAANTASGVFGCAPAKH